MKVVLRRAVDSPSQDYFHPDYDVSKPERKSSSESGDGWKFKQMY